MTLDELLTTDYELYSQTEGEDKALFEFAFKSEIEDIHNPKDIYDCSKLSTGLRVTNRLNGYQGRVVSIDEYACAQVTWDDGTQSYNYPNQLKRG